MARSKRRVKWEPWHVIDEGGKRLAFQKDDPPQARKPSRAELERMRRDDPEIAAALDQLRALAELEDRAADTADRLSALVIESWRNEDHEHAVRSKGGKNKPRAVDAIVHNCIHHPREGLKARNVPPRMWGDEIAKALREKRLARGPRQIRNLIGRHTSK